MTGDYHDTNKDQLDRVSRMMRGEFNEVSTTSGAVAGSADPALERSAILSATTEAPPRKRKLAGQTNQLQIAGMEDDTPAEQVELGREYSRCQTAESRAKDKSKAKKQEILDMMHELCVDKFRLEVDGNMRWLEIDETEKLKWRKSETAPADGED